MPFGIGPLELILLLVIVLILFAGRIPGVGRSLGTGMREFKDAVTRRGGGSETEESGGAAGDEGAETHAQLEAPAKQDAGAGEVEEKVFGERPRT